MDSSCVPSPARSQGLGIVVGRSCASKYVRPSPSFFFQFSRILETGIIDHPGEGGARRRGVVSRYQLVSIMYQT